MSIRTTALPINDIRDDLAQALQTGNRVVIQAPTGAGKSTQIPQMILDGAWVPEDQQIVVLQPRRLAARVLAQRVAEERQTQLGTEVGYHIRFDRVFGKHTRIKFVTEGILLRMMLDDPELKKIGCLVFDEFHERHLYSDLGIAMATQLQKHRPDLKLIVMSATLDTEALEEYLKPCRTLSVSGRLFPIS